MGPSTATTTPEILMGRLLAAFPADPPPRPTISLWLDRIGQEDLPVAAAAVSEVIETWSSWRFPPIAVFARAAADRREAFAERGLRAPELEAPRDPERKQQLVRLRDVIAAAVPPAPKPPPRPLPRRAEADKQPVHVPDDHESFS
jgi:hypothetical protein